MLNKNIFDDVKQTGLGIRDWLGPYYSLGGAVAFCIGMFRLLDPSGRLSQLVAAGLFLLTVTAWVAYLWRKGNQTVPAPEIAPKTSAKPHAVLLAVTVFFVLGILLSEAIIRIRKAEAPEPTTPGVGQSAPEPAMPAAGGASGKPPGAAQPGATLPAKASPDAASAGTQGADSSDAEASTLAIPAPAAQATPRSDTRAAATQKPAKTNAVSAESGARVAPIKGASSPEIRRETVKPPPAERQSVAMPIVNTNRAKRMPQLQSQADSQRCSSLLSKFSLGEELKPQEKHLLETSCR